MLLLASLMLLSQYLSHYYVLDKGFPFDTIQNINKNQYRNAF